MNKKKTLGLLSLVLAAGMTLAACGTDTPSASSASATTPAAVRMQDDFYEAINGEWMASAVIPSDQSAVGGFMDLDTGVTKTLMADFDAMIEKGVDSADENLQDFLAFYELTADMERRNKDGAEPLMADLERIEAMASLSDLDGQLADFTLRGIHLPFSFSVMADMGNADVNALYASSADLFLMDKSYYEEGNATGEMLAAAYIPMFQTLLTMVGKTEEEAATITAQAMEYDRLIAQYAKSAEESSNVVSMYNPVPLADFVATSTHLDLNAMITQLTGTVPETIISTNPMHFENLDDMVSPANFELLKSWMYVSMLSSSATVLSEEMEQVASSVSMMMNGTTELSPARNRAYEFAASIFSPSVGIYYGQTYFGEEAKEDVTQMVNNFVEVYKARLEKNDWLSPETIEAAIRKLDNMSIQIGYPDSVPELYSKITVDAEKSLYENLSDITYDTMSDLYSKVGQAVDREQWNIGGHVVNATYSPMTNTITFPAAILQAPFYSLEQTPSQNYGGIGAVIAHEISHAFDPNGSMFDEKGNLNNWWTEEDYAAFEERTNAVRDQFDGMEFAGGTVNGTLTVTENTADAGGLSVALEVTKSLEDGNLEEFFTNWAVIWRMKSTPEYEQMLLTMDSHAPNKLRANVQLSNLDEFYETFDVKEGDGMYIAPDSRVAVW